MGTRQTGTLLTRASWWGGAAFLVLAFILSLLSGTETAPRSVLDQAFPNVPATTPPPASASPVLPLQEAPATPAPSPAPTTPTP
jgi:preprotein translocase subunit SecG